MTSHLVLSSRPVLQGAHGRYYKVRTCNEQGIIGRASSVESLIIVIMDGICGYLWTIFLVSFCNINGVVNQAIEQNILLQMVVLEGIMSNESS